MGDLGCNWVKWRGTGRGCPIVVQFCDAPLKGKDLNGSARRKWGSKRHQKYPFSTLHPGFGRGPLKSPASSGSRVIAEIGTAFLRASVVNNGLDCLTAAAVSGSALL